MASDGRPILFILTAPSGGGKKTFREHVTGLFPEIRHVPTYTTRPMKPRDVEGVDYTFLKSEEEFFALVESGEIWEYSRTYDSDLFGSPKRLLNPDGEGNLLVELDYRGMFSLQAASAYRVVSIFIAPRDLAVLTDRINSRGEESDMQARLANAHEQLKYAWAYDYVLVNDDQEEFLEDAVHVVKAEILRRSGVELLLQQRKGN